MVYVRVIRIQYDSRIGSGWNRRFDAVVCICLVSGMERIAYPDDSGSLRRVASLLGPKNVYQRASLLWLLNPSFFNGRGFFIPSPPSTGGSRAWHPRASLLPGRKLWCTHSPDVRL